MLLLFLARVGGRVGVGQGGEVVELLRRLLRRNRGNLDVWVGSQVLGLGWYPRLMEQRLGILDAVLDVLERPHDFFLAHFDHGQVVFLLADYQLNFRGYFLFLLNHFIDFIVFALQLHFKGLNSLVLIIDVRPQQRLSLN